MENNAYHLRYDTSFVRGVHPPKPVMHFSPISDCPSFQKIYVYENFKKFIISPYFRKFTSDFLEFVCFLHTLRVFRSPLLWPWCIYASYNARTGRLCHSLCD